MKYFLFTTLVIIGLKQTIAQEENKTEGHFRISPAISFNFGLPSIDSIDEDSLLILSERNNFNQIIVGDWEAFYGYKLESDQLNYSIGVDCEYIMNQKISINSGLKYSNKDFSITPLVKVASEPTPITRLGNKALYKLRYIEIPILMRYYINRNKINFFVDFGILHQINIVANDDISYFFTSGYFDDIKVYPDTFLIPEKYVINGVAGIGVSYKLNSNSGFQLSINYTHSLSKTFEPLDSLQRYNTGNDKAEDSFIKFNYLETKLSYYIKI